MIPMNTLLFIFYTTYCLFSKTASVASHSPSPRLSNGRQCYENIAAYNRSVELNATCIPLKSQACLDINLPYKFTAISNLATSLGLNDLEEIELYLSRWTGIRNLSRCWQPLQSMLCSSLLPKCETDPLRYAKPTKEMCLNVKSKSQCKIIGKYFSWPNIPDCDDTRMFAQNCTNGYHDLKFVNISLARCPYPLVATEDNQMWLKNIEGCAMPCNEDPRYSFKDRKNVKSVILWCNFIILLASSLGVWSFHLDWIGTKKSKIALIQHKLLICQWFGALGYLMQFIVPDNIPCKPDDTILYGLHITGPFLCEFTFVLTYYSSTVECIYHAHLGFLCYEKLGLRNASRNQSDSKVAYFALTFPFILMVLIWFIGLVDGHNLFGICTVGRHYPIMAVVFYIIPQATMLLYGNFKLAKTSLILVKSNLSCSELQKSIDNSRRSRITRYLYIMVMLIIMTTLWLISLIGLHWHEFSNTDTWEDSTERSVGYELNLRTLTGKISEDPPIVSKPQILIYHLHLILSFGIGSVRIFWICSHANMRTWIKKLITFLEKGLEQDKAHKKRHRNGGYRGNEDLDVTMNIEDSTHHDPVDMTLTREKEADRTETQPTRDNGWLDSRGSSDTDMQKPVRRDKKKDRKKKPCNARRFVNSCKEDNRRFCNPATNGLGPENFHTNSLPMMMDPMITHYHMLRGLAEWQLRHTPAITPAMPTFSQFGDFQFTHGMSQQSQVLQNPLSPSRASNHGQSGFHDIGSSNLVISNHSQLPNLVQQPNPFLLYGLPGTSQSFDMNYDMLCRKEEDRKLETIKDPTCAKRIQSLREPKETSAEESVNFASNSSALSDIN